MKGFCHYWFVFALTSSLLACGSSNIEQTELKSFDPIGETAEYQLNKSRARTSSIANSGQAKFVVVGDFTEGSTEAYQIELDYEGKITLFFSQQTFKDKLKLEVPRQYFTPEFWDNLVATGNYDSPTFDVTYLKTEDLRLDDGRLFPQVYHVQISGFETADSTVKNLVLDAWINPELPVLGAVRIDLKGQAFGLELKTGFDLK